MPTVTTNVVIALKPEKQWIKEEELASTCNSRALNAIVNDVFTLGNPILKHRIVKKILRFLPERFDAKVVVIEEIEYLKGGRLSWQPTEF